MINYNTILSSYDERGTLLKWLKTLQEALEGGALSSVTTTTGDDYVIFHFVFADGTSVNSPAIPLEAGPKGDKGDKGDTGPQGPAATVAVGTVETLPAGSDATVTNSGTSGAAVLNFGIPEGEAGQDGGVTINGYAGAVTTGNGLTFDQVTGELSSYDFNLTDTGNVNLNTITKPTGISNINSYFYYALNADKSIGKLYGCFNITFDTISSSQVILIPLGFNVAVPASAYNILVGTYALDTASLANTFPCTLNISVTGEVSLRCSIGTAQSGKTFLMQYPACLYFFKDFGDTPDNRSIPSFEQRMKTLDQDESAR